MQRVLNPGHLLFCGAALALGFVLGMIVHNVRGEGVHVLAGGLETGLLAGSGAFLAGSMVSWPLGAAGESVAATILVGLGLLLWPGAIDGVWYLVSGDVVIGAGRMEWIALAVGGGAGLFAGVYRVYDWRGFGWLAFPLDVTWGLAGTTNGVLIHLVNTVFTTHAPDRRQNAHRYLGGFRVKSGFAFTQGAVMSNLRSAPPSARSSTPSLYRHERVHVWQNRVFGPFFVLSFLLWMGLMLLPGLIAGAVDRRASPITGIEWWTYYDNPWEVWAYRYGGTRSHPSSMMCWPSPAVIVSAGIYYPVVAALGAWLIHSVWIA